VVQWVVGGQLLPPTSEQRASILPHSSIGWMNADQNGEPLLWEEEKTLTMRLLNLMQGFFRRARGMPHVATTATNLNEYLLPQAEAGMPHSASIQSIAQSVHRAEVSLKNVVKEGASFVWQRVLVPPVLACLLGLGASSAFTVAASLAKAPQRASSLKMADIGDTGVSFDKVAREWRCKYTPGESGGPGDSASLKACQDLLAEYLPKLKALPAAEVTRQVCGGCMDFKVSIVQPLDEHGAWAEADYNPLEEEFVAKLKAIDGVSQVETQEITFVAM